MVSGFRGLRFRCWSVRHLGLGLEVFWQLGESDQYIHDARFVRQSWKRQVTLTFG